MNRILLILSATLISSAARAGQVEDFFFDPHAAIGYNPAQGTNYRLGVDVGLYVREDIRVGIGAYASAGEHPSHDREIGAGPFIGYVYPVTNFLVFSAREDIDYIDLRYPIETVTTSGSQYSHKTETGLASATSVALHVFFTPNFVLSGGYRFVLALTNSALDDDRSGAFVGFAFGI